MVNTLTDAATPKVGDGATYYVGSDSKAYTVVDVSPSGHKVTIQRDRATRTDDRGMSDQQDWSYERDTEGDTCVATRRRTKQGIVYRIQSCQIRVVFGHRHEHFDFSF